VVRDIEPQSVSEDAALVQLRDINKRFGSTHAVRAVSLVIRQGEIHALIGENGAGKSTLGRIIAGAVTPDSGEILLSGRRVFYRSPREALHDGISLIAQEIALVPQRSVIENVYLRREAGVAGIVDRRKLAREYATLVEQVGFDIPPGVKVGKLRQADQQKVEILRALARGSKLIVMDEPTAALSRPEAAALAEVIRRLNERGTTIVYVSHFLEEVLALAHTVTIMRDGGLVRTSEAAKETPERLVADMLGRPLELVFPDKRLPPECAAVVCRAVALTRQGALDNVSLEVRAGEIVGLAGLIGAGRTEVARAIFGVDRLDSGTVYVNGRKLKPHSPAAAMRAGVALLPESRREQGLIMKRSVEDNVTLPNLRDVSRGGIVQVRNATKRTLALLKQLDVRMESVRARVSALSGGNQQKVLFGKWLFRRPSLLLADEPTRGVDVGAKTAIYSLIRELAASGMAILVISSEIEEVLGLAHRVLVMRAGRIVGEFEGDQLNAEVVMRAAFEVESAA